MDTHCLVARGPPDGAAIETGIFLGTLQCLSRSSKLFRFHLSLSNRVSQSLADEWQLAQKYLAIEQARLEDRLRVEVDLCPENLDTHQIVRRAAWALARACLRLIPAHAIANPLRRGNDGSLARKNLPAKASQLALRVTFSGTGGLTLNPQRVKSGHSS